MLIYIPLLICIIGALIFGISQNGKATALAKDMFWCGLLVTLYQMAGKIIHIP